MTANPEISAHHSRLGKVVFNTSMFLVMRMGLEPINSALKGR